MRFAAQLLRAVTLLSLLCTAAFSEPRNFALVVGVDEYPSLRPTRWLNGAGNDAIEIAKYLRDHGFNERDITVLTDVSLPAPVRVSGLPTKVAIQDALRNIATAAQKGDFVYLQFSGHGSLEPAIGGAVKKGGLEAIFLPRDIGAWRHPEQAITNALRDDDFLDAITKIRNRGAFVWAVFDSCNSGDIARGAPSPERERRVDMVDLGITLAEIELAERRASASHDKSAARRLGAQGFLEDPRVPLSARAGSVVVFSAAQSYEPEPEIGELSDGKWQWHGLFTRALLETLVQYPGLTYREIGQQIIARYAAMGRSAPTPEFQGDLDAYAFGVHASSAQPQWPIHIDQGRAYLRAGSLAELGTGSVVALMEQPADATSHALGFAKVNFPRPEESELRPIDFHGKRAVSVLSLPATTYGRLVARSYAFTLAVARPCDVTVTREPIESQPLPCGTADRRVDATITRLTAGRRELIRWVEAGDSSADIRLVVFANKVWFTPPSGELRRRETPSIAMDSRTGPLADRLEETLRRIARAKNLLTLARGQGSSGGSINLHVFSRPGNSTLPFAPVSWDKRPKFRAGSELMITLHNAASVPMDVTVLYLDAAWGITALYPQTAGRNNRIDVNQDDQIGGGTVKLVINANPPGVEHLIVIAVPARAYELSADYSFLAQPTLSAAKTVSRGGGTTAGGLRRLLMQAGFTGGLTRGPDSEDFVINQLTFQTLRR